MRIPYIILVSFLLNITAYSVDAQNNWLWAESIDRSNTWNGPFYKPYNTADKLLYYREDSAAYCTDCSLANILWKGIEANKIFIYQADKKGKLSIQKITTVKTKILAQLTIDDQAASVRDISITSEIVIYRKPDSIHTRLSELPIEWIALKIPTQKDTISIYLKSKECFAYLNFHACKWIHPLNHQIRLSINDALIKRNYIIRTFNIVSTSNLNVLPKSTLPPLAQVLSKTDTHTSKGNLEVNTDTLLIRLQAILSADITSNYNRGFNKAHLIQYLLQLHAENKIKGYTYHEAGYFTIMQPKDLRNHLLVETIEDGDYTVKRVSTTSLTTLHTLKTLTKISSTERLTNDWLLIGISKEISTAFNNTYAIAFKYEDILAALATTNMMWYYGTSQTDSMRLDEALKKQYIDYTDATVYSIYGDTITSFPTHVSQHDKDTMHFKDSASILLYMYTNLLWTSISESQQKIFKQSSEPIKTYQLHYFFTDSSNSVLTKKTVLVDALLDAIRTNKIQVYKDENLKHATTPTAVLNKLDKTRFYKTGNRKKDSIYISKIPVEDRFIKSSDLKEFTLSSTYTTTKKKSVNQGFALGIFIPAELNPQYETDTLCYVSFNEFVLFLQKNKTYKKLSMQFKDLLNERAIVSIEDFYDILLYDANEKESTVPNDLPAFVREHLISTE